MLINFSANSHSCRVHAGVSALERIPGELARLGSTRVVILCGASVARNTDLIAAISALCGSRVAGIGAVLDRHATLGSVLEAVKILRDANADCIIAVGAGSATMAARCAAILLSEKRPLDELVTHYPEDGPPVSPKLMAPKIPIINVLTAATASQNRAGSAIKVPGENRRLELFDPKTRPVAIIWDKRALATAPVPLAHATGATVVWASLMGVGAVANTNVLAQADRLAAFDLARLALPEIGAEDDFESRLNLCIAAFLLNRAEDAGASAVRASWPMRVCYALGSAIFTVDDSIDPGSVYAALTSAALRHFGDKDPDVLARLQKACCPQILPPEIGGEIQCITDVQNFLAGMMVVPKLSELGVEFSDLSRIRDFALRNFNADPRREFLAESEKLLCVLHDAF